MKDWMIGVALFLGVILIIALPVLLMLWFDNYNCNQLEKRSGKNTEWYLVGGCYVEVNDRMIPLGNWRGEYDQ